VQVQSEGRLEVRTTGRYRCSKAFGGTDQTHRAGNATPKFQSLRWKLEGCDVIGTRKLGMTFKDREW